MDRLGGSSRVGAILVIPGPWKIAGSFRALGCAMSVAPQTTKVKMDSRGVITPLSAYDWYDFSRRTSNLVGQAFSLRAGL
jgi:hypothetical protein